MILITVLYSVYPLQLLRSCRNLHEGHNYFTHTISVNCEDIKFLKCARQLEHAQYLMALLN
jgi:hypothetical protein